jgi:anti-sigma B factor antagonist
VAASGLPGEPSAERGLAVTVDWHGRTVVLSASGEVDLSTAPKLEAAVHQALGDQPERLIIDLSEVRFFASAGITPLVATHEATRGRIAFGIVVANDVVFRSLKLTAVDCELTIYSSLEDALAG